MRTSYGFEMTGGCQSCAIKGDGFFCNLPEAALKAFDAISFSAAYPSGAVLFSEQERPRGAFLLCKGRVKLSITSSDGKMVILRIVNAGEVMGLHAVVSGKSYQATAETLEPSQTSFVRRDDFLRFLRQHPEASLRAAEQLSENYQAACQQVRSLGLSHSATGKLAGLLLEWASAGRPAQQENRVKFTLTHEEIGQLVGLSRETVTRTLSEFRHRRLVSVKGSTLVIQDRPALQAFAGV